MIIINKSSISQAEQRLIEQGYGEERLNKLDFCYRLTEEEKEANRKYSHTFDMNSLEWQKHCDEIAVSRSSYMEQVMQKIAEKLCCCQYNTDGDVLFDSADWDFFFWCNTFWNTTHGRLSGRDYDGFSLTFNEDYSKERREQIYQDVLSSLKDYEQDEHVEIVVRRLVVKDAKKIAEDAKSIGRQLVGKRVQHIFRNKLFNLFSEPIDVRIVESDGLLYFMKKRARTKGYRLEDEDILQIYWRMQENS